MVPPDLLALLLLAPAVILAIAALRESRGDQAIQDLAATLESAVIPKV